MHSESSSSSSSTTGYSIMTTCASTQMKRIGRKKTGHPFTQRSNGGKWVSEVREPHAPSMIHPEMPVDGAALALHSGHRLPPPASSSNKGIQRAATDHLTPIELSSIVEASSSINGGSVEFVDEEAMFNMPLLLDSMAEGMLLTPPAMKKGFNWSQEIDDDHIHFIALWNIDWMMDANLST